MKRHRRHHLLELLASSPKRCEKWLLDDGLAAWHDDVFFRYGSHPFSLFIFGLVRC